LIAQVRLQQQHTEHASDIEVVSAPACIMPALPVVLLLLQVQQQLWRQQALAEAASSKGLPGSPSKAAAAAARKGCSSPAATGSPTKKITGNTAAAAGRDRSPLQSRLSPRGAAFRGPQGPSSPRKLPLAATIVAKRLTVDALLRGTVDIKATCAGWEASPVLIRLLTDVRNKLLCKAALRIMRIAATAASQRDVLLSTQLPMAVNPLKLSAAFRAWKLWSSDRSGARAMRQELRQKVRSHHAAAAVRAWHEAAVASAWLQARQQALVQQRQALLLVKAFSAWRCARPQQQVKLAQHAVAVLWHARVTTARVLMAWACEARQAALLSAMAWSNSDDSTVPNSAESSAYARLV
jgi:hypothetical protein